jgi:hypothetical protein
MLVVAVAVLSAICYVRFGKYKREAFINSFSPNPRVRTMVKELLQKGESDEQIKKHVAEYVAEISRPAPVDPYDSYSGLKFNQDTQ